jgi:hypothetical protein
MAVPPGTEDAAYLSFSLLDRLLKLLVAKEILITDEVMTHFRPSGSGYSECGYAHLRLRRRITPSAAKPVARANEPPELLTNKSPPPIGAGREFGATALRRVSALCRPAEDAFKWTPRSGHSWRSFRPWPMGGHPRRVLDLPAGLSRKRFVDWYRAVANRLTSRRFKNRIAPTATMFPGRGN